MKAVLSAALIAMLVSGCVVRRTSSTRSDVMDLDDSTIPADTAPTADMGAIEPLTTTTPPAPQQLAPTAEPAVASPKIHTVAAGETLWSLAVKYYADGKQWPKIVEANPGLTPERMPIGKKITIP